MTPVDRGYQFLRRVDTDFREVLVNRWLIRRGCHCDSGLQASG